MVVGFDFGTTNSLISVILRDRAVNCFDEEGLPYPSIVRYEGEQVIAGREARASLDAAGLGIHGNTVRSPKFLLGDEAVDVGGVERSPVDIVHDVVSHVKANSLRGPQGRILGGVKRAVVTIPVTLTGPKRAALRDAFRRADIEIVQFVHEPFAALYGYLRSQHDPSEMLRRFNRRNVLVVDWGGGTLDLTLCRIEGNRVVQLRNGGSDEVGGDQFDQAIREAVIASFIKAASIPPDATIHPDARLRLLQDAENNKIALSERPSATFYRPGFFTDPSVTLEYRLTRDELDEITRPLVMSGLRHIESLLDSVGIGPSQVSTVLAVGGMAAMPAVRSRLYELFGPQRVEVPANSATLVAEGAAWIAHDNRRLQLAKPLELRLARGAFLPILKAGTNMPIAGEDRHQKTHLFCTDPTDGVAKFQLCVPTRPSASPQISDPRTPIGVLTIDVHAEAKPFAERLELDILIDDNLILTASAWSAMAKARDSITVHDLEFGLALAEADGDSAPTEQSLETNEDETRRGGGLAVRANIADEARQELIPGEVLYAHHPAAFRSGVLRTATQEQVDEHLYYQPCSVCKRDYNDPACRCATRA